MFPARLSPAGGWGGMCSGWAPCIASDPLWANLMEGEANFTHSLAPAPLLFYGGVAK